MIFYIILSFTLLICINHLRIDATTTLNPNGTECEEMDKPGWSFFTLANKTLDVWPWSCLNIRYNETTLNEEISKLSPDLFDATARDYIGYVQYYVERRGANLCSDFNGDVQYYVERRKANLCSDFNGDDGNAMNIAIAKGYLRMVQYMLTNTYQGSCPETSRDSCSRMACAASYGHLDILKYLLREKKLTNYMSTQELFKSIALGAAKGGQQHVLKYLVDEKGFIIKPNDGALLFTAAQGGNVDMLKYLLYEKNINATELSYEDFYVKRNYGLLECGNLTLLCNAALRGKWDAVIFSVEKLNNTEVIKYDGKWTEENPLVAAVKSGSLPVIKYLIEEKGADLNIRFFNYSLLHFAAAYGHLPIVKYLVELRHMNVNLNSFLGTPLYGAIREGRLDVVKYLAGERNASLQFSPNSNALLEAAGRTLDSGRLNNNNSKIFKFLVDDMKMISRINEVDDSNETALMKAAYYGKLDILKFLIDDRQVNTTIVHPKNETLLHLAAEDINLNELYESQTPVLKYLIEEKGFQVSARTTSNETVLDLARKSLEYPNSILTYLTKKLEEESSTKN